MRIKGFNTIISSENNFISNENYFVKFKIGHIGEECKMYSANFLLFEKGKEILVTFCNACHYIHYILLPY